MKFVTKLDGSHFLGEIPKKPAGRYSHFVTVRVTESYPLFQTDGELNRARVQAGLQHKEPVTRVAIFKRKQSTPERLTGREVLRHHGLIKIEGKAADGACDYNEDFCKKCPDCIIYGFAIGQEGSEKSKVVVDTAYSLTPFEDSHATFTLNAPYEHGTMSQQGETTSRINSQDHVVPQVFFPSIVTLRDPTEATFLYVANNILRTKHYGAQTTRTGRLRNILVGLVLADGEITSNLRFTQAIYDALKERKQMNPPDPLQEEHVVAAAQQALPALLKDDGVVYRLIVGEPLEELRREFLGLFEDEARLKEVLMQVNAEASAYAAAYISKSKKAGAKA